MSNPQKRKGDKFENEMLKWIKQFCPSATRRQQAGMTQRIEPDIRTENFAIECKNRKSLNIRAALKQAYTRTPPGLEPFVLAKLENFQSGQPLVVAIVPLGTLETMIG